MMINLDITKSPVPKGKVNAVPHLNPGYLDGKTNAR